MTRKGEPSNRMRVDLSWVVKEAGLAGISGRKFQAGGSTSVKTPGREHGSYMIRERDR